jgi:formylglycine-generating enzyme required for sulfatase activity
MLRSSTIILALAAGLSLQSTAQWLNLEGTNAWEEPTELAGPRVIIEYSITDPSLSAKTPAYVFIHYRIAPDAPWRLLSPEHLQGNGAGIIEEPGAKKVIWWGTAERDFPTFGTAEFRVRAIPMVRVPGGEFAMKSLAGQGRDQSGKNPQKSTLPTYHIARLETTIGMYVDYLNEAGIGGTGYNPKMDNLERCGILRGEDGVYTAAPGRELHPVSYVSWYDAMGFLQWCGLRLPDEAEWEKAYRGGNFLDGDDSKQEPNPNTQRRYPWGDELPNDGGLQRCNYDGDGDGYASTAPVGSFPTYTSPYGVHDMAGNVNEWTLNWYTTPYHTGLDGYRVVRGGSWLDLPEGCDGVSGATTLPLKEGGTMGFRGVYAPSPMP